METPFLNWARCPPGSYASLDMNNETVKMLVQRITTGNEPTRNAPTSMDEISCNIRKQHFI